MNLSAVEAYEGLFEPNTIIDGVVDAEKYFNSKYKIAWFLKEAYSNEKKGFHMKRHYIQPKAYEHFFRNIATPTWHPIIYSSYGALNDFQKWTQMDYIRDKPQMCNVIRNIAIINANKAASLTGTFTLNKNLEAGFKKYKDIIKAQIQTLQPEIHIFCNTFYLYKPMFNLKSEHKLKNVGFDNCEVWEKDGKLFLDVYHPANRSQKREKYVNQIVRSIEAWAERRNLIN